MARKKKAAEAKAAEPSVEATAPAEEQRVEQPKTEPKVAAAPAREPREKSYVIKIGGLKIRGKRRGVGAAVQQSELSAKEIAYFTGDGTIEESK